MLFRGRGTSGWICVDGRLASARATGVPATGSYGEPGVLWLILWREDLIFS